jgi:uncharacterized protein (TIGR03067 family)
METAMNYVLCLSVVVLCCLPVAPMARGSNKDNGDTAPTGTGRVSPGVYKELNEKGELNPPSMVEIQEVTPNIVVVRGVNGWVAFAAYDEARKEYRGSFEWRQFGAARSPGGKWADLYQIRLIAVEGGLFHMTGKSKDNDFIIRGKVQPEEAAVAPVDEAARQELKALQGKWKAVAVEIAGNSLPRDSFPAYIWEIQEDGKTTAHMPGGDFPVAISVDPKKSPRTFVNLHLGKGEFTGKKQYGIYKLEGDKLTVCQAPPGAPENERPTDFNTKHTRNVLTTFERVKEDQKP